MGQLGCWPYIIGTLLVVGLLVWWKLATRGDHLETGVSRTIDLTPTQVQGIQDIGQWEFLSVSDEELVDTVAHGFFGDSELMRIYYGTLRLGIDLHKARPQWLAVEADTIVVATLPPIELLDRNFIDEARTQAFFESGKWTAADRQSLYNRAYRQMLARCWTKENIRVAEQHAVEQMTQLLRTMGFKNMRVSIEPTTNKGIEPTAHTSTPPNTNHTK